MNFVTNVTDVGRVVHYSIIPISSISRTHTLVYPFLVNTVDYEALSAMLYNGTFIQKPLCVNRHGTLWLPAIAGLPIATADGNLILRDSNIEVIDIGFGPICGR